MYCTQCGGELQRDARFCPACGAPTLLAKPTAVPRPLLLDKRNKKIAGVCSGFARYLDMDVTLVRVVWLVIAFAGGIGFLGYLAAWIVTPSDHGLDPRAAMEPNRQAV
ncbi:MAG: PspC domain-containing protein [Bryobacteraceae bacterium]|jgi:phage shock protein C